MPLELSEIYPGAVAILDVATLVKDPLVKYVEHGGVFRNGPFVCAQVKDGISLWVQLTGQKDNRGIRLEIKKEWRIDGSDVWKNNPQFVHDARKPFIGPNGAFVLSAAKELPHQPHKRPNVSVEGIEAVIREVKRYKCETL